MPGDDESRSLSMGTARFALKVQECTIEVSAQLPEGPVHPAVLLPVLQDLSNSLSSLLERSASQIKRPVSCREGCGACCRQAVPITPVEARVLSQWIGTQPEERQAVLRQRFRNAAARIEESGIGDRVRAFSPSQSSESAHALGLDYFALHIACPFLEDERCTIHQIRPLRCREYLVVSPAEQCAHPEAPGIVSITPPVVLSQILGKWNTSGEPQDVELILLAMLDEWVAKHPPGEDSARRTAPELLQEFLSLLGQHEQEESAGPRRSQCAGTFLDLNAAGNPDKPNS